MLATIWSRPYRCPLRLSRQSTDLSPSITSSGPSTNGNGTEASRRYLAAAATAGRTANDPVRKHRVALVADEAGIRQAHSARRLIHRTKTDRRRARSIKRSDGCDFDHRLSSLSGLRSGKLAAA